MSDNRSDRPTNDEARKLRDHIRVYGADCSKAEYETLMNFGIWYADQCDAADVILSDWTPAMKSKSTSV